MKVTAISSLILALALSAGCAATPKRFNSDQAISKPVRSSVNLRRPVPTTGSLFLDSHSDLITDLRARQVGDLVVVEIVENSKANNKADSKAERKNTYKAGIPYLMGYEGSFRRDNGDSKSDPLIQADFQSKHDTKAEQKKEDSVTASIACTVVEVLPNGYLVIRGSREIQVGVETQYVILQGIVRPSDITTSNTVASTQVADARISYTGRGVLSDKQQPGWLARLLDHIWPF